jgi:hypothetical protein
VTNLLFAYLDPVIGCDLGLYLRRHRLLDRIPVAEQGPGRLVRILHQLLGIQGLTNAMRSRGEGWLSYGEGSALNASWIAVPSAFSFSPSSGADFPPPFRRSMPSASPQFALVGGSIQRAADIEEIGHAGVLHLFASRHLRRRRRILWTQRTTHSSGAAGRVGF